MRVYLDADSLEVAIRCSDPAEELTSLIIKSRFGEDEITITFRDLPQLESFLNHATHKVKVWKGKRS